MNDITGKLEIDDQIIQETKKCHKNFACLNGHPPCCEVECYSGNLLSSKGGILFVKPSCDCNYKYPFGNEHFCTCPVRQEIYHRYGE